MQLSIFERWVYLVVGLAILVFALVLVLINPEMLQWLFGGGALLALLGLLLRTKS